MNSILARRVVRSVSTKGKAGRIVTGEVVVHNVLGAFDDLDLRATRQGFVGGRWGFVAPSCLLGVEDGEVAHHHCLFLVAISVFGLELLPEYDGRTLLALRDHSTTLSDLLERTPPRRLIALRHSLERQEHKVHTLVGLLTAH